MQILQNFLPSNEQKITSNEQEVSSLPITYSFQLQLFIVCEWFLFRKRKKTCSMHSQYESCLDFQIRENKTSIAYDK